MRKISSLILSLVCSGFTLSASAADDAKNCVTPPQIGKNPNCPNGNSARIHNRCDKPVDIKICIRTTRDKWDCGVQWGVQPGGSWSYPSCFGTNDVVYDARPAGSSRKFANPDD